MIEFCFSVVVVVVGKVGDSWHRDSADRKVAPIVLKKRVENKDIGIV